MDPSLEALPAGTVAMLFTDIEGSTALWDAHHDAMAAALARHHGVVKPAISRRNGIVVKDKGDGFFAVFGSAAAAVRAAVDAQRSLQATSWPDPIERLRVRMAIHAGPAEPLDGDYHGPTVNLVARLEALAHGEQILMSEAAWLVARDALADECDVVDLGYRHLKGVGRRERVFQVSARGLRSSFPPVVSAARPGVPLPESPTTFVGRQADVDRVAALLGEHRLVTLIGPGGIGKTRLALESARRMDADLRGGAVFADLGPVEAADVARVMAESLGTHAEGTAPIGELLAGRVTSPTLIVVDNFEHVLEAAPVLAGLMSSVGPLRLLVTSRSPLRVRGEQVYRVGPLNTGGSGDAPSAAVRLFYDRAAAAGADVEESGPDRAAVEAICDRLDGLPLAIELVAAQGRLLSVRELETRIGASLDSIGTGGADLPERQRTMRATIEWSLRTLTSGGQRLFDSISVFPAGATLEMIERVEPETSVLDDLATLVDASLVVPAMGVPGGTRYRQLAPVREYGTERLRAAGRADRVLGRLVDDYRRRAPDLGLAMSGGPEAAKEIAVDQPNLVAAMRWALQAGRAEDVVEVMSDLWIFWFDGDRLKAALDLVHDADRAVDSGRSDWLVGMFAFQTGDYETATMRMSRAVERFEAEGDDEWLAVARAFEGVMDEDLVRGRRTLEQAAAFFDQADYNVHRYLATMFLSVNAVQGGAVGEALDLRRRVLRAAKAANYPVLVAWAHWNLALALFASGDREGAREQTVLTIDHMAAEGYLEGIASAAGVAALLAFSSGRHEDGLRLLGGCDAIWERIGASPWPELTMLLDATVPEDLSGIAGDAAALRAEGAALGTDDLVDLVRDIGP